MVGGGPTHYNPYLRVYFSFRLVVLTLFSSCPYLGMLYLIITPPSTAGRFGDFLS